MNNKSETNESDRKQLIKLRPITIGKGTKTRVIQITDITFHSENRRPTVSPGEKVRKAFAANKPGRIFQKLEKPKNINDEDNSFEFSILETLYQDPAFAEFVQKENDNGVKVILEFPKEGVPVLASKDSVEFMESKKAKRLLRKFAKDEKEK